MTTRGLRSSYGPPNTESYTMTPEITITALDLKRLGTLLDLVDDSPAAALDRLDDELARAKVVEAGAMPPDVVTMNSRVRFEDSDGGRVREITLVYPDGADAESGRVSVLAPIGSALLGLRVGQSIELPSPGGRRKRYSILEITYQPE